MSLNVPVLKSSWALLEPHSEEFGALFYQTMFKDYPAVKYYFQYTNVEKQRVMLLKSLGFVVGHLDNTEALVQALKELGRRHLNYKTEPEHYKIVGANLIKTMGLFFQEKFTKEIEEAWTTAYNTIVSIMLSDLNGEGWTNPEPVIQFKPQKFTVVGITEVSPDTRLIKFEIPHAKTSKLPLDVGRHIQMVVPHEGAAEGAVGEHTYRDYTPVKYDEPGHFELLIKKYEQGKMSKYVHDLKVGDHVLMRGVTGAYEFKPHQVKKYAMIAAGTGICPIYQVINAVLNGPAAQMAASAEIKLLFANKTSKDILLAESLDQLKEESKGRFTYTNILSREEAPGCLHGHVDAKSIETALYPKPEEGMQVLICGPDAFSKKVVETLKSLGYTDDHVFVF